MNTVQLYFYYRSYGYRPNIAWRFAIKPQPLGTAA